MERGKRQVKASLLCFPFPSCPARFLFLSTQRGFCGGERGKPAEKHIVWARMKSRNDIWRLHDNIWDQNLEYFVKKSRSISFSLGYNFVRSQLRFWRSVKPNLFSNSEDHISLSCSPRPLGMGLRTQSDPDVGNLGRGENEAADSYGRPFPAFDPVGVEEGTLLEYPSRHYNSFNE